MILPAAQYGDWADVKKRMRHIVTRIKRGDSILSAMTEDGTIDAAERPGMLMMGGRILAGGQDFHCFMPWQPLWQDPPKDLGIMDTVFQESLSVSWGVLGLLAFENKPWFYGKEERFQPFLSAALRVWDELDAAGPRYFDGVQGRSLWSLPSSLHYVLANMGVPSDVLRAPLPAEGPRGLLRYADAAS
jgi:hypothetical protein